MGWQCVVCHVYAALFAHFLNWVGQIWELWVSLYMSLSYQSHALFLVSVVSPSFAPFLPSRSKKNESNIEDDEGGKGREKGREKGRGRANTTNKRVWESREGKRLVMMRRKGQDKGSNKEREQVRRKERWRTKKNKTMTIEKLHGVLRVWVCVRFFVMNGMGAYPAASCKAHHLSTILLLLLLFGWDSKSMHSYTDTTYNDLFISRSSLFMKRMREFYLLYKRQSWIESILLWTGESTSVCWFSTVAKLWPYFSFIISLFIWLLFVIHPSPWLFPAYFFLYTKNIVAGRNITFWFLSL